MVKAKKLVIVTATHHPYHKLWMKIAEEAAKQLGLDLEVKYEDYLYLIEHGDTDEYGMAWVPQILAEFEDGSVRLLLSQLPLNEAYQPDKDKAVEIIVKKVKELESGS
jgi:hypothetical protein